jgi:hypothetical protein
MTVTDRLKGMVETLTRDLDGVRARVKQLRLHIPGQTAAGAGRRGRRPTRTFLENGPADSFGKLPV